jgi:RHS repeat-associated protein
MVGGSMVGVRFERSNQTVSVRYFHQDHLGSIAVLTDETGNVVERDSYGPWGKRRFTNGSDDPTDSIVSQTIRGYTGQEMLADVALVHLNGRVYDPLIARMLSADPMVPDPLNGQTRNRYSYVGNNPLAFTDPTGYCFLNLCGVLNDISRFINNGLRAAANFLRQNIGSIIEIAVTAICTASVVCAPLVPLVSLATSVAIAGVTSGSLTVALQTAAIQVFTMGMDFAIGSIGAGIPVLGELPAFLQPANLFKDIAHALVGCARFVMSGGSCRAGALSGAVPAIAGSLPLYGSLDWTGRLLFKSVLGGLGSVAGGGKFGNGAVTGAFQYLFNDTQHNDQHNRGVDAVKDYLTATGNVIVEDGPVAIAVPGFGTSYRFYDFLFLSPDSNQVIGAEVKTGMYDTARLNSEQIAKDAVVVAPGGGGVSVVNEIPVNQVEYFTYCSDGCTAGDLRPFALRAMLETARIPVTQVIRPIPGPLN